MSYPTKKGVILLEGDEPGYDPAAYCDPRA
jgi:hypothetical protein